MTHHQEAAELVRQYMHDRAVDAGHAKTPRGRTAMHDERTLPTAIRALKETPR